MSEQVVRALGVYLDLIGSQADKLRTIASRLENGKQQKEIQDIESSLRETTRAMREQVKIIVEWAWKE